MKTNDRNATAQKIVEKIAASKAIELIEGPFGYLIKKSKIKINKDTVSLKYEAEGCDGEIQQDITNKQLNDAELYEDEITFNEDHTMLIRLIPA